MSDIIGLFHEGNLDRLVDKVKKEFQSSRKVLTELPTDFKRYDGLESDQELYFYQLRRHLISIGKEVIPGDYNHYAESLRIPDWFISLERHVYRPKSKMQNIMTTPEAILWYSIYALFCGVNKVILRSCIGEKKRNEGFSIAFEEHNPDLVLVGDHHAQYLHKEFPETTYEFFK